MVEPGQSVPETPLFSIIVAVYNDWAMLEECLQSLAEQSAGASFEVIIVDDGSSDTVPEFCVGAKRSYPLKVIRQSHAGIPAARNLGIRNSQGAVLLFVDADCRFRKNTLAALSSTIAAAPEHDYFQLRIEGNLSNLAGRAEELRLITFQNHMLQPDGRIRYLNTAGFAIRRTKVNVEIGMFDPVALRAEDTLLLANLMQRGELPLFVPNAVVEHAISLSLIGCIRKDIRTVRLEGKAYDMIAAKGVKIRVSHRERLRLLSSMWRTASHNSIGRSAWFVLVIRQAFQRVISFGYQFLRGGVAANA